MVSEPRQCLDVTNVTKKYFAEKIWSDCGRNDMVKAGREIMERIWDKGLFIIMGITLVGQSASPAKAVMAMLLGVIAAALGNCIENRRYRTVYTLLFLVGCFLLPELLCFLPVIFYDCATERRGWLVGLSAPVYLFLFHGENGTQAVYGSLLWLCILALAAVLGLRTLKKERLERELIRLRDSSTELNMVLHEKNKALLEKQDYEIYLATLRERNRIAREIHDNVGHMLSRSILQVGALLALHRGEPLHGQLMSVNATLGEAMDSIRESVHDLHDEAIDLEQALFQATKEMAESYQLTIDYDMSKEVPRSVKYCLIATVREAMSNIVRHSNADRVSIILREHPGFYQLTVEDNGTVAQPSGGGLGISNMKERVEALAGVFRIHCDGGFRIFISIPKEQTK